MGHLKQEVAGLAALKPAVDSLATRLESVDAKFTVQSSPRQTSKPRNEQPVEHANKVIDDKKGQLSLVGACVNSTQVPAQEGLSD